MKIILSEHYGFCMGVKRAIRITSGLSSNEKHLTIYHEIVHNETIIDFFKEKGINQAGTIDEIEEGTVIIPAHGAPPGTIRIAESKGLKIIDASCPLVKRIHQLVEKLTAEGYHVIHFGDREHDETVGIMGHASDNITVIESYGEAESLIINREKRALTAQTTAGLDEFLRAEKILRKKYPQIKVLNTICNATTNRQKAAAELARQCDLFLVIGSAKSANTKRLAVIAAKNCRRVFRINSCDEVRREWLFNDDGSDIDTLGITAGASTPDTKVAEIIEFIKENTNNPIEVVYPEKRKPDPQLLFEENG